VIATTTSGDVACMIAEPIQGVGGFAIPPDGLLGAMQAVLDEYGIPFVSDEVQTGWGRTGEHFWGYQAHGIVPDMLTFAKGLGNGLPVAGVVARAELMDCLGANSISTFGGGPLVTAGALANLRYLLDHDLQGNALRVGRQLLARLREPLEKLDLVAEVRGKGLMIGVELVKEDGFAPNPEAASAVLEHCREAGLLIGKGGLFANCLRIAPPLTITREEADRAADLLIAAIEAVGRA
jgi:4-aminobutyrate aminotransferase